MPDLVAVADYISRTWYKKWGWLLPAVVAAVGLPALASELFPYKWAPLIASIVGTASVVSIWAYSRRTPRAAKNRLGFCVCIALPEGETRSQIREDFVISLKRMISQNALATIQFIEIPQHIAREIHTSEEAQKQQIKSRSHFMLWGSVRDRMEGGREVFFLELQGAVRHAEVSDNIKQRLSNEFGELLPSSARIYREHDLVGFGVTSDTITYVAKYIIGIAAFISNNHMGKATFFL